jgi:hypothetical protein
LFAHLHAAQAGHAQIHQHQAGFERQGLRQADLAVLSESGTEPLGLQHQPDSVSQRSIVVDY